MRYCILSLFFIKSLMASDINHPYAEAYDDKMLFLHALVNYQYNADWQFEWEKRQYKQNLFRISVGSVTTVDLLVDAALKLNVDLGAGWRFQGAGTWDETRHKNTIEKSTYMGLERHIYENLNIHLLVNPAYDKEHTDINTGFSYYAEDKETYLRLALLIEDFVYDSKNDQSGITEQSPLGMTWSIRTAGEKFSFYTSGRLSTGFKRIFPDTNLVPDMRQHDQHHNQLRVKAYYLPSEQVKLMIGLDYYDFSEVKLFNEKSASYNYQNRYYDLYAEYFWHFLPRHRGRILGHLVYQDAAGQGYGAHDYSRTDILNGLFYEYLMGSHSIEFGYMFTVYDFAYQDYGRSPDLAQTGYVDKLKLGWFYYFPNDARITISVSHQVSIGGFGGANLQYIMFF